MSKLLDPMHRRHIQSLDVLREVARPLEVGFGRIDFSLAGGASRSNWRGRRELIQSGKLDEPLAKFCDRFVQLVDTFLSLC